MVKIIKPIVKLDFDELTEKTDISLYKDIPVNYNHGVDSDIGKVVNVYADKNDENLIIAEMEVKDEIWEKYGDNFHACSVELHFNSDTKVVIPTAVSLLTTDLEPAIDETKEFTLVQYDDNSYRTTYIFNDTQNNENANDNIFDKKYAKLFDEKLSNYYSDIMGKLEQLSKSNKDLTETVSQLSVELDELKAKYRLKTSESTETKTYKKSVIKDTW